MMCRMVLVWESFFFFFCLESCPFCLSFFLRSGVYGWLGDSEMGCLRWGVLLMREIRDIRLGLGRIEGLRGDVRGGWRRLWWWTGRRFLEAVVEGVGACCLGSLRLDSIMCGCYCRNSWMDGAPWSCECGCGVDSRVVKDLLGTSFDKESRQISCWFIHNLQPLCPTVCIITALVL